jgi:hypothetical protein
MVTAQHEKRMSVWNKQCSVSEFSIAQNVPLIVSQGHMEVVSGNDCVDISALQSSAVRVGDVNLGHVSRNDVQRSWRPRTACDAAD